MIRGVSPAGNLPGQPETKKDQMMKVMKVALFAAGAVALVGSLLLSGCCCPDNSQGAGAETGKAAGGKSKAASKPLTQFGGKDFITIYDTASQE